ncbi:MAG: Grx4 family monothiol glutaredoxin [Pseudomonadota bacterium]
MTNPDVLNKIKTDIASTPVLLFMKGTREEPMCGFSAQVCNILNSYGVDYKTVDVLSDWGVREGIKEVNSWPTIPQLFIKGKFIGGCDIAMELHRNGELKKLMETAQ